MSIPQNRLTMLLILLIAALQDGEVSREELLAILILVLGGMNFTSSE